MQTKFPISAEQQRTARVNAQLEDARRTIRRARKSQNKCSPSCVVQDLSNDHTPDCPNRNRWDVV